MSNIIEYKGYLSKIEYSAEDGLLFGKLDGIRDHIDFYTEDPKMIEAEFRSAVDDYLEFCEEVGKEPNKPYKGSFNVRISPELHKKAAQKAVRDNESLNKFVEKAIEARVNSEEEVSLSLISPEGKQPSATSNVNINFLGVNNTTNIVNNQWNINIPYSSDVQVKENARV